MWKKIPVYYSTSLSKPLIVVLRKGLTQKGKGVCKKSGTTQSFSTDLSIISPLIINNLINNKRQLEMAIPLH